MKFNIGNEKHQLLGYFKEYDAVCWIEQDKIHKYSEERFEFSLKQIVYAFYLKFNNNSIYQHKLFVNIA